MGMMRCSAVVLIRAAAVVAAVIALDHLCIEPFRGNLVLRDALQRSTAAVSIDRERATILARANLQDLSRVERSLRLDPAWYMLYGSNCEMLDRWPEAADAYTRALRIDDRPEIYVNRGLVFLHLRRTEAAVADLATAARFDPSVVEQLDGELRARVAAAAAHR
jgi:tetratricopeptide (TPR) repeat protein